MSYRSRLKDQNCVAPSDLDELVRFFHSRQMLKLFRFADFWGRRTLDNSAERIERALFDRTRRLVAGIHVDDRFEKVAGSLVVARGRGKSLRVLFCDSAFRPIPEVIRANCLELRSGNYSGSDYRNGVAELADVQLAVVEELKLKASKYVDRVLAISVTDPGLWHQEFGNETTYLSLCDATRLAERTGVNVIDAWPDRDIAVGGRGMPLDPLCLWLLQADRDRHIARKANISIQVGQRTSAFLLPPSDGLDAEIPDLGLMKTEGTELIDGLLLLSSIESAASGKARQLLVSGVHSPELLSHWRKLPEQEDRTTAMLRIASSEVGKDLSAEELLCSAMKWISDECKSLIERSLQHLKDDWAFKRRELQKEIEARNGSSKKSGSDLLRAFDQSLPDLESPGNIMVDASDTISDALVSRLRMQFAETQVTGCWSEMLPGGSDEFAHVDVHGPSLTAALLGFMHIDQMPANVPGLTGAHQQRILGRLTPGRPNSWRNLLREMADYEPSAMKLRDAV